jgi:tight adherence protein B
MTVEYGVVMCGAVLLIFVMGYLCYDSWIGGVCAMPALIPVLRLYKQWKHNREKREMLVEFKDMLYALASGLQAGYSVENAWISAQKDMQLLYPEDSSLLQEVNRVTMQLRVNVPIETALQTMAESCDLEEIYSFSEVLDTAKRSGGNIVKMMDKTAGIIAEKIEVEQEIQTMLSGKKLEQRIMCMMPFFLLCYLRITNGDYMDAWYHNPVGILIMTGCIAGTLLAMIWGSRIIGIEV